MLTDINHIRSLVDAIMNNMAGNQPLPVRFQAACALERILRNDMAKEVIKVGISLVLKGYLSLVNEIDNGDVLIAFASVMSIFKHDIKPVATEICNYLKQ